MANAALPVRVVADGATAPSVRARWATVCVQTSAAEFVGRVLVPEATKKASKALRAGRQFVFLTQVSVNRGETTEPFVAISRKHIKAIAVLHEGVPEVLPVRVR